MTSTDDEQTPAIDILNSFYIEDIERCMTSVRNGEIPVTLRAYLTPLDDAQRVDLYTPRGRQAIVDALHPRRFNAGHWLEDASRKMSLMQQFAINAALGALEQDGLFSVNGPPGTGKTTLLRDVICENVVRRARLLAALPKAADALASAVTEVQFPGMKETVKIRALLPELTGFEMVVASSNNAAVENISNDLPKRKQLGQAWRDMSYLQPVAHKIAAQTDEGKFAKLEPGDVPWGLISCVLGRAQNRRRFAERFYFGELPEHLRDDSAAPCHIRDWVARYKGVNFDNAKRAFLKLDDAVRTAIEERARYADLHAELSATTESEFTRQAQSNVEAAEAGVRDAAAASRIADDDLREQEARLTELQEDERLIDRSAPGVLARLFRTGTARRHAADVVANAQAQREIRGGLSDRRKHAKERESHLRQSRAELDRARTVLDETRATWTRKRASALAVSGALCRYAVAGVARRIGDRRRPDARHVAGRRVRPLAFATLRSGIDAASGVARRGRAQGRRFRLRRQSAGDQQIAERQVAGQSRACAAHLAKPVHDRPGGLDDICFFRTAVSPYGSGIDRLAVHR